MNILLFVVMFLSSAYLIGGGCWMAHLGGKFNKYNAMVTDALATAERARLIGNIVVWERAMKNATLALQALKLEHEDFKKIPTWPRLVGKWNTDYYKEAQDAIS